ncbi:MAG: TPM domain-containing protein [Bacteroidales bacterium]|nr:TPM domain-containing protein [Bacteroidales bacterium]MCF8402448.1 TPM domain-containing protein [Bacteroidales bacterium]
MAITPLRISSLFVLIIWVSFAYNQDLPEAPNQLVNDQVNLLSAEQKRALERKLVNFDDTTSTQIAILITNDLAGYDIQDFSQRVAHKWGIGRKGKDNGVIIVLVPKTTTSRGQINIDVGYGLEPIIPDITAKRIVDNEMIPHFKTNDYYGGLEAATDVIISLAAGHFSSDEYNKSSNGGGGLGLIVPIIVLIIVISMINRRRRGYYTAGRSSLPLWTALWLGSSIGRGHGGSWNNFSSGSGGFGGGGFGGFGGGGFGGGGASGSW